MLEGRPLIQDEGRPLIQDEGALKGQRGVEPARRRRRRRRRRRQAARTQPSMTAAYVRTLRSLHRALLCVPKVLPTWTLA